MKKIFQFVRANGLSGLENVIINICTMVKGYDYTYVSTSGRIDKYLKYYGIKHIIIPHLDPLNIFKVIKKYKPDIVQAHDAKVTVFMSFSVWYCKKHHIRMISELHNDDPKMSQWWRLRSILYALASFSYKQIIVVSNNIVRDYAYRNIIKDKAILISNIVNPYRIKSSLNNKTLNKKWDCAFLGRLSYQKNPCKFIKIVKDLKLIKPNIKAVMIGDGDLINILLKLSRKYKLNNNIDFVGFQHNPYKYVQLSKVLVLTSRYEGLPLTVLESLVIGVPVVSTPLNVLKQLFGKYGCYALNNNEFVTKIWKSLSSDKKYYNVLTREQVKLKKINNVNKFIESYKRVYK